jgi:NADPH2:quinone reductase
MKAIVVRENGGPEVLRCENVEELMPGAGQVLVKIHAVGINPVETYFRSGRYPVAKFPYTPGSDAAGEIAAVGDQVSSWSVGHRVYVGGSLTGTYAEYALVTPDQIHTLPDRVSFDQGAAVNVPYATAYRGLIDRAKAKPGETVLVHGASGGVGTAAVQLAHALGITTIGTASTENGRKLVAKNGADHVLDHSAAGYLDDIMKLTGGKGVDVILEMAAHINLGKDLTVLGKFGRVIVIGCRGPVEIIPNNLMGRDADIRGMTLFNSTPDDLTRIHAALVAGLTNGTLTPVVGKSFSLAQAPQSHLAVLEPGAYGKIVLTP